MKKTIKDLKPEDVCRICLNGYYVYGSKRDDDFFSKEDQILVLSVNYEVYMNKVDPKRIEIKFLYNGSIFKTYLNDDYEVIIG